MTIVHGFDIAFLAERLKDQGSATLRDAKGKRLMFVMAELVFEPTPGVWIAYESNGAMFWSYMLPMNRFELVQNGFPIEIATILADVLKALLAYQSAPRVQPVALPAPEETMK